MADKSAFKDHVITIRVSKGELDRMHQRASERGLNMTEYILASTIYDEQSKLVEHREVLSDILLELNRQGNNLNQIARTLNMLAAEDLAYESLSSQADNCMTAHLTFLEELRHLFHNGRLLRMSNRK